jgi:hypothetical protein
MSLPPTPRISAELRVPPKDDADLRFWMENMVWYHRFTTEEIGAATGLSAREIEDAKQRFGIARNTRPSRTNETLTVLPYPGGRHPRVGFLDGAIDPQRETKLVSSRLGMTQAMSWSMCLRLSGANQVSSTSLIRTSQRCGQNRA